MQTAFSPEVLEEAANSGAIELDPDTVVVLRVKEHNKPKEQPLEQVAANIRERLAAEKAAEEAQKRGEALIAELREGRTSSAAGESWKVVEAASRGQEGVDPKLLQAVFRMQRPEAKDKPSLSGVTLANGDYVVIRLNGVSEPEEAISDDEKAMYRRFLASRSGQADSPPSAVSCRTRRKSRNTETEMQRPLTRPFSAHEKAARSGHFSWAGDQSSSSGPMAVVLKPPST